MMVGDRFFVQFDDGSDRFLEWGAIAWDMLEYAYQTLWFRLMLDDPENKTWIDDTEIVPFGDRGLAIARCRQIAEQNELKGEGRCTLCGVRLIEKWQSPSLYF